MCKSPQADEEHMARGGTSAVGASTRTRVRWRGTNARSPWPSPSATVSKSVYRTTHTPGPAAHSYKMDQRQLKEVHALDIDRRSVTSPAFVTFRLDYIRSVMTVY